MRNTFSGDLRTLQKSKYFPSHPTMLYPEAASATVPDKFVTILTKRFLVCTRYAYERYEKA